MTTSRRTRLTVGAVVICVGAVTVAVLRPWRGLGGVVDAVAHARLAWVLPAVVIGACVPAVSAVALYAGARRRAPFATTVLAEYAGSAANRVTPAGLGCSVVRVQVLRGSGLTSPDALAATAVSTVAGGVVAAIGGTAAIVAVLRRSTDPLVWTVIALVLLLAVVLGAALARADHPILQRCRLLVVQTRRSLADALARPAVPVSAVLAMAVAAAARIAALALATHAVDGHISVWQAGAVYFGGSAAATVVPVPGGVGPAEVALAAGLILDGVPSTNAVAAVAVYRAATLWLPSLAGVLAAWRLRVFLRRTPRVLCDAPVLAIEAADRLSVHSEHPSEAGASVPCRR